MVDAGAPGWRRGVAVAVAAQLLSVLGFSCAVSFLPLYIQTLGVDSPTEAAVCGLASYAGRVEWLLALFLLLGCFTGVNTAIATLVSSLAPRDRLGMSI